MYVGQGLLICNSLDAMHCKNLGENLMNTIFGTKDTTFVYEDLKECGIQSHLWLQHDVGKIIKHVTSYVLSNEKKDRFILGNLKTFSNYVSSLKKKVHKDGDMKGMKSHDCDVMMQTISPLCMCHLMAKGYKMAIIQLSHVFKQLCAKIVGLVVMRVKMWQLCWYCWSRNSLQHFLIPQHTCLFIWWKSWNCGIVHTSCMYLVECYFKTWKGLMRNKQGLKEARHKVMC